MKANTTIPQQQQQQKLSQLNTSTNNHNNNNNSSLMKKRTNPNQRIALIGVMITSLATLLVLCCAYFLLFSQAGRDFVHNWNDMKFSEVILHYFAPLRSFLESVVYFVSRALILYVVGITGQFVLRDIRRSSQ